MEREGREEEETERQWYRVRWINREADKDGEMGERAEGWRDGGS